MNKSFVSLCCLSIVATILIGCGQSKPDASTIDQKPSPPVATPSPATTPASTAPTAASSSPATPVPTAAATPAAEASTTTPVVNTSQTAPSSISPPETPQATDAASQLIATAKAQGDTVLSSLSSDLTGKVNALTQSAVGNDALKSQLSSSLKSLAGGNDSSGLATLYQAVQSASLTPSQAQVAKEVGNLASAYVVQKNFSSLDGAQGDVATIVNSLRQGKVTQAIPAIQKVAQNANLTPTQKQLVASIADRYAPGVSKAAGALNQGLQSIPGLGGK